LSGEPMHQFRTIQSFHWRRVLVIRRREKEWSLHRLVAFIVGTGI
jgi:hypothetical protein